MVDSDKITSWIFKGGLGVCAVLLFFVVIIMPILIHNAEMRPREITGYVIGYTTGYNEFGLQRTVVTLSYAVVTLGDEGEINVHTEVRRYGGEYTFEVGELYRIRSEGNFWWWFAKITEAEHLPVAKTM